MKRIGIGLSFFYLIMLAHLAEGRPLGLRPDPPPERMSFLGGVTSDLWATPYANKNSPLRLYEFRFATPFLVGERWSASFKTEIEGLSSGRADLLAGRHRVLIGSDLRGQSYGLNVNRKGNLGDDLSLSMSYDSSSDEPYKHGRDKWIEVSSLYRCPPGEQIQWLYGIQYSRNRGFYNNIPLPLVGVIYRPRPGFTAVFGLPFISLSWDDPDSWSTIFTTTLTSVVSDSRKKINSLQDLFLRFGMVNRAYLHENRIEDDMRLFFEEKYADFGFSTKLSDTTAMYISVGKSFDRNFYEAKSVYAAKGPKTNMNPDFYGRLYFLVQL